ncbi:MAG: FadR family transcriptional regulator [Thermomicrobiales bacterium]|nr:FadR family transcriptional regulator [Thermomicrobiales bacterium]
MIAPAPDVPDVELFSSVRRAHLWSSAVDQIRDLIESGRLPAGSRLPGERELCQQLGISRVSLREAIRVLESHGFVEVRPGRGTYARLPEPDRSLETWLREHNDHLHQLFELRGLVEPGLARLAARRRDAAVIAALETTVRELELVADLDDLSLAVAADAEFHRILAHATGNSIIDELMGQAMLALGDERRASLQIPGQIGRAAAGHRAILTAIAAGDSAAAEEEMRRHLGDAILYIDSWMEEHHAQTTLD